MTRETERVSLIPGPVVVVMMVIIIPGPPAGESGPLGVAGSPLLSVGGVFGVAEAQQVEALEAIV